MFPFYYIDCEGNLWVPCNCPCSSTGSTGSTGATGSAGIEIISANELSS